MTPRTKKLLARLTAAVLTLSMLSAIARAAKNYATGGETEMIFPSSGVNDSNAQQPGPSGFTDVSWDDWFFGGVDYVSQKGLMSGTVTGICSFRDVAT